MDDLKALEQFYTNDLREPLARLEKARKRLLLTFLLITVVLVVANVSLFLVMEGNEKSLAAFTIVGSLIGFACLASSKMSRWANDFKTTVISPLLHRIEPRLTYYPGEKIDSEVFHATCLYEFSQAFDYDGEDLVTGVLAGVPVSFSELHVTSGSSKSGTTTHFRGMFLVADVDVGIDDPVWLLPHGYLSMRDKMGRVSGLLFGFLNRMSQREGEEIELEDNEFSKLYQVVAEDESTATRLLNDELREKLIELRQRSNQDARVSFQPNRIAVALSTEGNLFEPRLTKTILSYEVVRQFAEDVTHALSIVLAIQPVAR